MAIILPRPRREIPIVEDSKGPSLPFQQWINKAFKQIEQSVEDIDRNLALSLRANTRTVTATGSLLVTDYFILANASGGNIVLNLPPAVSSAQRLFVIKKIDASSNTVTIDPSGTETIDGATTFVLSTQYSRIGIVCDGATWWRVD